MDEECRVVLYAPRLTILYLWFLFRVEYPQMIEDCENNETFIDDFDDSSSDLESIEMNEQERQPVRQIVSFNSLSHLR